VYLKHEKKQGVFMKFTKLSLAALVAMGLASSASAVENVKVSGQLKLWYQTSETNKGDYTAEQASLDTFSDSKNDGLFKKEGGTGDLYAELKASGDLTKKVGFGITFGMLTSAGLEKNLVNNVASGAAGSGVAGSSGTDGVDKNPYWLSEAYFTYKAGKTIVKVGRQTLDTPLAYTETWNAAPNTFEAAVLVNQDIKDTTLVGALVSRGNGTTDILGGPNGQTIVGNGSFYSFGTALTHNGVGSNGIHDQAQGAWALGAVTTLIPMTTAQVWFYNIEGSAQAEWLQADVKLPFGLSFGAQFANLEAVGSVKTAIAAQAVNNDYKTTMYAAQVGYSIVGVDLAAAYSNVSAGTLGVYNYATGGYDSKLYTASVIVNGSEPDVSAIKLSAGTKLGAFDLSASYASYDYKKNEHGYVDRSHPVAGVAGSTEGTYKPQEINLSVGTKIDEVNLTAAYVNVKDYEAGKRDLQAIRVIAAINF
jgi:imipenem/basic amino acid-specific outer membrane pore